MDQLPKSQILSQSSTETSFDADNEAIRRCLSGDGEAYRHLVDQYQQHVSSIMWRFSRDQMTHEELVHDVFVEAYSSLYNYRPIAPFSHWLARIATRMGYQYWKRQARKKAHPTVSLEEWDGVSEETSDALSSKEAANLVHRMLAQLPPRDRLVLTLRYLEEYSVEETAEITAWSKTMVKVQALRAKKKLKKLLDEAKVGGEL
jgi:RNA polymerase sigma-70 factor (ECF subfamily)